MPTLVSTLREMESAEHWSLEEWVSTASISRRLDLRIHSSDEAAVSRREPVPSFEDAEQQRSHEDESSQHGDGHRQRHAHLLLVFVVIIVLEVVDHVDII